MSYGKIIQYIRSEAVNGALSDALPEDHEMRPGSIRQHVALGVQVSVLQGIYELTNRDVFVPWAQP